MPVRFREKIQEMLRKIRRTRIKKFYSSGKAALLSILSAALLILSFPQANFWILAWVGFVPLFFALENKSGGTAFLLSFLTGVVFWSGVIYWLVHVTLLGTIVLILYLALYFGIFGFVICRYRAAESFNLRIIFISSLWVLLEYVRGDLFTGFPWALLGYSQYLNLPVIQIADITGAWGVSFIVMSVNAAVYLFLSNPLIFREKFKKSSVIVFCLALTLIYGYLTLYYKPWETNSLLADYRISVVQGNIPQEFKWNEQYTGFTLRKLSALTRIAAGDEPDLIIWPEAAAPGILGEDDWVFRDIKSLAVEIKVPLLTGAVVKDNNSYFGSAILINRSGVISQRYDKIHLVPFGEYIPLKETFPFLKTIVPIGDIEKGKDYTIFELMKSPNLRIPHKFAVLDCFEDVFPEIAREFVRRGAGFLVNITNDAWYKETSAPYQHLQASVFRALENRVYLARSANTGVSGFISPEGKIISLVSDKNNNNIFVEGFDTKDISSSYKITSFYTKFGDLFVVACFLLAVYAVMQKTQIK